MGVISVLSMRVFVFQGEFKRQLCLQSPFITHLFFVNHLSKCVYVNITYPERQWKQKKNLPLKHKVLLAIWL